MSSEMSDRYLKKKFNIFLGYSGIYIYIYLYLYIHVNIIKHNYEVSINIYLTVS